eukprot:NODE_74_length_3398_cov_79.214308_g68_i0.p1 GENE.NODE_74_length_3398_cov_79.214308_g68_i0~~NODE_74_length_3398_cov_79.214308_g68_i0.p1  ORF type:complete len:1030 (+),score=315.81 NODE_74_length_3398_cov_79.214308_g68_i0:85-3174(+)
MRQENRANGADEPPSKKRKIAQKFRYGSILSLNFTNFMTFTHAALNPGPHLNLITGPNGSGKSSFFCALFLVLGGSPKLIGRSPSARDFIQHSKDTATIEVELCTPQGTVRLKRVILLNESKWFINNVPKTEGEVHKVVARNNIILDNLTQFLPQDRVKAFATLSPVELLQKTEEAILDPAVVQLHDQLIGIGADLAKSLREQQDTKQVLEVLSAQNKAALKEVERHRHKQQLLRKREECLLAIPFFEFARKQKQGSALNTKVEEAKNALSVEQEKEEKTQSQDLDLKRKKLDFKIQQTAYAKKKFEDQRETLQTTFEKVTHETEGLLEEESLLEERRVQRERGLQQATAELKALETAVVASVPLSQLEESVREKAEEVRQLGEQYERILDQLGHQRKRVAATHAELNQTTELLNRASSVHSTRLGVTWQTTPNCVEVWHWIEAHRALLIGNVYLVALELEVSTGDPLHAKYLEAAIPRWLMNSFVCEDPADQAVIAAEVRDKLHKQFCLILRPVAGDSPPPSRLCDLEVIRPFGITHWLDQIFRAPASVAAAILDNVPVQKVAVGTAETAGCFQQLSQRVPTLQTIFTPDEQYHVTESRYNHQRSTRVSPLHPPRLLIQAAANTDALKESVERIKRTLVELQAQVQRSQTTEQQARMERERCHQQKMDLQTAWEQNKGLRKRLEHKKLEVSRAQKFGDVAAERQRIRSRIKTLNQKRASALAGITEALKGTVEHTLQHTLDSFERDRVQELHRVFQEEAKHKQTRLNDCRKKAATLEAEYTQLKADLMHLRRQALEKRAEYEKRWDVSTDQSIAILKALPDNVEKLQADARAAQLEAEAIYADPAVLIEYTNRANQIRQLSARLDTLVCEHEALARKLATSKERWLTPLTQAIQELNLKFQSRCEAQGITGVIELDYKDESNFGTYGIELSCSFRAGEAMHRLDPYRQSGGERSVVTILYLLALQSLNQCPLRVVDEIDQGMDASNQRKVFYQMLDACAEPDTPQSFLITPKLLPDMIPSNALNWTCL